MQCKKSSSPSLQEAGESGPAVRVAHKPSGRFESRWSRVGVSTTPSVLLRGMEGAVLGVWVAHGEGGRMGWTGGAFSELKLLYFKIEEAASLA